MKKTNWLSLMLALVMCLFLLPADAQAKTITETVTISYTPSVDLPDSDEIFAAYVEREMYRPIYGDVSMFGSRAREQLNSNAQKLYDYLLPGLKEIAAGNRSSSEFTIPDLSELGISLGYSAEDLNVDSLIVDNAIPQSVVDAFSVAVDRDLMDDQMLVNALLSDCPYDMYWYDKSYADYDAQEFAFMYQMDITYQDGKLVPANVTISFRAADAYGSQYIIDTAKTGAASSAVANAQKIVDSCASLTNEAKLAAYRDEICDLVSYNTAAAEETYTGGYGDPWQLIYVFDGNSSTNVVCEGYSKAFQYLCDLSNFSGDVYCYSVTGTMTGGTGAGPHMWNIVQMNGGNYLVDVTNCDTDSIGHPDELFLVCEPASGTWETEYVIKVGDEQIIYAYDADTFSLWGESELKLCAPSHTHNWVDATCTTPKTCSECKATEGEALGHKWINATCTDPMTCSVCGATEGNALGHNFGEWEITTAPTCTQDGVQTRKCSACEETETENIAAKGHSMTLTAAVTPTCTTTGNNAYYTCGNCNKLFKDEAGTQETTAENEILPVLAHSYSKPVFTWAEDNTCKATYNCTVGGESATVDCTVSSVSKEASCKDSGEIVYTATVVISNTNYTDKKTVTVEALGHKYESVVTKPTCTEKGYTTHTCSVCNDTYTDSELPANGHSFGEWEITTAPTCTKDGVQTRKCSACDKIETEAISATGEHNYAAETERVDPTCTEDGYVIMACGCGAAQKSTLTAAGHKYESVVTEPTCTEKGYTTHTCSVCNDTYTDSELPANGHSFGEWEITTAPTCAEDGVQTRKCSACEETKTETISATGEHHYVSETERVDPTCTKDGYVIMACGCGATQKSELKAPGHTPGEAKRENEKPATCENAGSYDEVVRCATCNEIITSTPKTIDKLDHTPGEPVVENKVDATCQAEGSYDEVICCTVCEDEISRVTKTIDKLTTHKDDDQNDVCDVCGKDLSNSVEVEEPENGKIEVNDDQPETGDEVIITITPEEGQEVGEVIVTDEQGNRILVTRMANGQYSFRQPAGKVIIRVAFKEVEPVLYTASIVGGNGSGSYAEGETVTISANAPADGMQFSGWTGAEGLTFTSGSVSTAQAAFTMPAADVTLTASYEAIADVKYIITFHANGGAGTMNPISVSAGKPVDLPACGYAAPEGLQFAGWSLSQDGAAIASPALFEADTTLYAVWTAAPVEDVKPVAPPKTGDDARLGLWTMLMLLSAAGIMASRKRRTN